HGQPPAGNLEWAEVRGGWLARGGAGDARKAEKGLRRDYGSYCAAHTCAATHGAPPGPLVAHRRAIRLHLAILHHLPGVWPAADRLLPGCQPVRLARDDAGGVRRSAKLSGPAARSGVL